MAWWQCTWLPCVDSKYVLYVDPCSSHLWDGNDFLVPNNPNSTVFIYISAKFLFWNNLELWDKSFVHRESVSENNRNSEPTFLSGFSRHSISFPNALGAMWLVLAKEMWSGWMGLTFQRWRTKMTLTISLFHNHNQGGDVDWDCWTSRWRDLRLTSHVKDAHCQEKSFRSTESLHGQEMNFHCDKCPLLYQNWIYPG